MAKALVPILCVFVYLAMALAAAAAPATEVYVPEIKAKRGQKLSVPVTINGADKLAGIKLVMTYDAKVLQYVDGEKTKHTTSLMHIINDKHPGRLIVVMAGARGISGRDIALVNLTFVVKKDAPLGDTIIAFPEIQLMTEQLAEVKSTARKGTITVVP
ncbi:MAG: cohesin domain-containing protein [Syntrophales bacterium]|nr:cohesin domain-containing protein [Syntrophales bacterium]